MNWPSSRKAWTLTILLTLAYVLSYVDRAILGLLVEPIKADIGLDDEQIGLLLGPAFAIFYATMGVPLGWLADRVKRSWLVAAGIALWSAATAASGLARDFWHLFAARMSVGVGEATLGPSAMSMIGDSFPPEKRGKPVAVYSAALSLGSGIAGLIGAAVLVWAKTGGQIGLPIVGEVRPWQFAFFVVGVPGLLLALAFLFVSEPPRQRSEEEKPGSFGEALKTIWTDKGAFIGVTILVCVMTTTAYSHGLMPSAFARSYGWQPEAFAFWNAIATLCIGPPSIWLVGWAADKGRAKGQADAPLRILLTGFLFLVPTSAAILLMPTPELALAMNALNTIPFAMVTAAAIMALLDVTPGQVRAQVVALYYMAISMAGLFLGPTTAGSLSKRVFGEEHLNWAISAVPVIYGIIPLFLLPVIRKAYLARLAKVQMV
jgi:MFS family permease